MLAKILSGALIGLDASLVTVEVDIASQGLPSFTIVGLPDKAVDESRERVRAAIKNSGAEFPARRITVNLAPADLPKMGPAYDLPIAVGILVASSQIELPDKQAIYYGELSLDGNVQHTNGALPFALLAKAENMPLYLPKIDASEAAIVRGITCYGVTSLVSLFQHSLAIEKISPEKPFIPSLSPKKTLDGFDMADIQGQKQAKRALEIAASGGHNVFLFGPPGSGKTLLARTFPTILPSMTEEEAIELTKICSVTGHLAPGQSLVTERPFRAPHHTISRIGLIGGGSHPSPGEISLAHRGVLFLDEFPEYPRSVLEALRQPLEDGIVTISRARGSLSFPAKFMLIAAANPCPCGNFGSSAKKCVCAPGAIHRYQQRISGPLLDRIDLLVQVPAINAEEILIKNSVSDSSSQIRARVQQSRDRQISRLEKYGYTTNAEMSSKLTKHEVNLTGDAEKLLAKAMTCYGLSARSYWRVCKVARTIADLANSDEVKLEHIGEALQYRMQQNAFNG